MKKTIPTKNYIIVFILSICTLLLTFYLMNVYNNSENTHQKTLSISEVRENELKSYITENNEVIIYMSSSNNNQIETFEKNLNNYILDNNLKNEFVYLDLNNVSENFYNEFYINYVKESNSEKFIIKEPTLVIINNRVIKNYINNIDNIDQVKEFLISAGVIE